MTTFIDYIVDVACTNMSIAEEVAPLKILDVDPTIHWDRIEGGINDAAVEAREFLKNTGAWTGQMEYDCLCLLTTNDPELLLFVKQQWLAYDMSAEHVLDLL